MQLINFIGWFATVPAQRVLDSCHLFQKILLFDEEQRHKVLYMK